jgi:hypothetical protein
VGAVVVGAVAASASPPRVVELPPSVATVPMLQSSMSMSIEIVTVVVMGLVGERDARSFSTQQLPACAAQ